MRANTGRTTITTVNFVGNDSASYTWNAVEARDFELTVGGYADAHRENAFDAEYVAEYGVPGVFEYELPGLRVVALLLNGELFTMFVIADEDVTRVHTALRTGRSMTIRYVKADGEVTRRRVEPQSLRLSKAGDVILRAADRRRDGDTRSFRWDRVTHTTLHRDHVTSTPTKSALWAEFQRTLPAVAVTTPAVEGPVVHTRHGYTGRVVEGTRAYGASGWSVIVELHPGHAHLSASGTTRASEDELAPAVEVRDNLTGAVKAITREAYDRLMTARDPQEPTAAEEALTLPGESRREIPVTERVRRCYGPQDCDVAAHWVIEGRTWAHTAPAARPLPGAPVVRWTPNPERAEFSPLLASGRCLDPSGSHVRPVDGRCPVCGAVAHYA